MIKPTEHLQEHLQKHACVMHDIYNVLATYILGFDTGLFTFSARYRQMHLSNYHLSITVDNFTTINLCNR